MPKKPQVAPYSGAMLASVARSASVRPARPGPKIRRTADHAVLAQHVGGGQHEVGGGDAFLQLAGELEADDFGDQHRDRLAEHRGFGLDAAHAPAQHAQAVDHGGVAVGADAGVGIGTSCRPGLAGPHRLREVFEVDLVADAGARGHGVEVVERLGAPLEEVVALAVALVFDLDVLFERLGVAEFVDHDRVVDDQVDGHQRVDLAGVAAQLGDRVAHRGKVDHAGHAGEVLQQHARRAVLDLVRDRWGSSASRPPPSRRRWKR
jgi:hypothetical protein